MGRRALQTTVCSTSSPSPTRQLHRMAADGVSTLPTIGRPSAVAAATRPSDLDVRQRRRRNDIVVESRRVVTVVKDDGDTADDDYDDRYDGRQRAGGHRFTAAPVAAVDQTDCGRLDDTLYELQRLLSNGKLPQRFLEKLISDDDITDRLLTEFEKLTAAATASSSSNLAVTAANPSPPSSTSSSHRRSSAVDRRPTNASSTMPALQQHRASSSSSTPEMTPGGRRSVRFDGTASAVDTSSAAAGRTRRRRRDGRNNRSRSRSGGRSGGRNRPPPPPPPLPEDVIQNMLGVDDDSAAEHDRCCSTCSSSSDSELDDLSVYRLPARRPYGPGAGAAARISYVPNDAIAYAKQQAGHRSPGRRTMATPQQQPSQQQTVDDKNCTIQ